MSRVVTRSSSSATEPVFAAATNGETMEMESLLKDLSSAEERVRELKEKVQILQDANGKRKSLPENADGKENECSSVPNKKTKSTKVSKQKASSKKAVGSSARAINSTDGDDSVVSRQTIGAKRIKMIRNKVNQGIKVGLKTVKFHEGFNKVSRSVTMTDFVTMDEFEAVFGPHGTLLQPTKENKPNSKVYIKSLTGNESNAVLGVSDDHKFKAQLWRKGASFSKSHKIKGGCEVHIVDAEVKYSMGSNKLTFKCKLLNGELEDLGSFLMMRYSNVGWGMH
mmetsp:Transcript_10658/g.15991  ORF Transcript_10658/g.15991 Transcript_10658/m.15991 type:complete len:281 (-) Transcript_10658:1250-2092(-)